MRANLVTKRGIGKAALSQATCAIPCFKAKLIQKLQADMRDDDVLEEMRATFAALADRARLKILYALKDGGEPCVCDVAHVVGTSISTASHHLRKLRDLKLLKYRNGGRMAYSSLKSDLAHTLVREALQTTEGVRG